MSEALKYLLKEEWTMGNGQCDFCCGKAKTFYPQSMYEEIGHEHDCGIGLAIRELGGDTYFKGELKTDKTDPIYIKYRESWDKFWAPATENLEECCQIMSEDNMKDKCEWVGGVFNRCKKHREHVDKMKSNKDFLYITWDYSHCPFCGEKIKPEEKPELIIKKSGNTWVARYEGVDYLCIYLDGIYICPTIDQFKEELENGNWKPIQKVEITDDIALLRPMVVDCVVGARYRLWGKDDSGNLIVQSGINYKLEYIPCLPMSLATVDDLD